jgi:carboxypeptidase Taq
MEQAKKDYSRLHDISRNAAILSGVVQILDWDQETYMPPGAASIRGTQLEALAGIIHGERTGKKFSDALAKLIDIRTGEIKAKGLSPAQNAALKRWRHDYVKEKTLPKAFVQEFAKLTSQSVLAWRDAKKDNTFHKFAPFLDKVIAMNKQKAEYFGYDTHPYDALLDQFEPEATTTDVTKQFGTLRTSITDLLKKITKAKQVDDSFLHGSFSHERQLAFSKEILLAMGFDFEHGRLDQSSHPFSSSPHPTDNRITPFMKKDYLSSTMDRH